MLPFFKPKKGFQFAGSGDGGGGGGDASAFANKTDLTAIILTGTTNTSGSTITSDTWFYLNGTPCIAKVDIASGATFTEGTNYEKKTVGSALSELNSKNPQNIKMKPFVFTLGSDVTADQATIVNDALATVFKIPSGSIVTGVSICEAGFNVLQYIRCIYRKNVDKFYFIPSSTDTNIGIEGLVFYI